MHRFVKYTEDQLELLSDSRNDIFTEEFLEDIEFRLVSIETSKYNKSISGKAVDKKTNGITTIHWNTDGHSCTYLGDRLKPNTSVSVRKDADTRYVFNGYIFTQEDIRRILLLTQ